MSILECQARGGRILHRDAYRFEQGDLRLTGPPWTLRGDDFAQLSMNVIFSEEPLLDRLDHISSLAQTGSARIYHQPGTPDRPCRDFLHRGGISANRIDVNAWL